MSQVQLAGQPIGMVDMDLVDPDIDVTISLQRLEEYLRNSSFRRQKYQVSRLRSQAIQSAPLDDHTTHRLFEKVLLYDQDKAFHLSQV